MLNVDIFSILGRNVFIFLRLLYMINFKIDMKISVFLGILFLVLCSCNKDETAEKWAKEEANLAGWIRENVSDAFFDKNNDMYIFDNDMYIEIVSNRCKDNKKPEVGYHVLVNFVCSFLDGAVEQVSYEDWQSYGAQNPSMYREGGPELWVAEYWGNMGIGNLYEGESANIYIPSRKLGLQDFKSRKYEIKLVQVIEPDLKIYQDSLMRVYMRNFETVDIDTVPINGRDHLIIYCVDNAGYGDHVNVSSVKTQCDEDYLLQENTPRLCDRRQPKTWDTKFSKMFRDVKKGGKIIAVMPYRVMYGEDPYRDEKTGQLIAPLHSVLKYKISIDN